MLNFIRKSFSSVLVLSCIMITCSINCDETKIPLPIYSAIKDIKHPTIEDYRLIQNYLSHGERDYLKLLDDAQYLARNFKIIEDNQVELPQSHCIHVNAASEERENCVLIYASFNRKYPKGLERLVNNIKQSDFKGHVLYQTGGWPDLEGGSLVLAHVPYAFKACFLREARRLGYKRALWLDTSVVPVVSLNEIFKIIAEKGYFTFSVNRRTGEVMHAKAAAAFGMTLEETMKVPQCAACIFGIDFTHEKTAKVVDLWYQAAQHPDAFFSRRSDQSALSIILYQQGASELFPLKRLPHKEIGEPIQPDSLFYLDRLFVH